MEPNDFRVTEQLIDETVVALERSKNVPGADHLIAGPNSFALLHFEAAGTNVVF
jgi:hypothetical protein